ncbi:enoyl-CoA hydratase [Paracoccus sp. p4-l81]|uniref:enoyl-CoA hydratase n=1 Tax=Paracoccus sp. p4-l81 TaxID=3342806 RepID=UPI0035BAEE42
MGDLVRRDDQGSVAVLTLNDPARLNALSDAMLAALRDRLAALATDSAIRVVILRATGKAFCAGHDLREMQASRAAPDGGAAAFADLFARCAEVMQMIPALPQPVIAQVHGIATAAGCQLVASCDLAVAATGTRFGVNGINIGLFCSTPMVALTRAIPRKAAFEMLATGDFIDATRARELGLINRVTDPTTLEPETLALAQQLAAKLGPALRIGKRAFYDQAGLNLAQAYAHAGQAMVTNMLLRDTDEGIAAFIDKRRPDWAEGSD